MAISGNSSLRFHDRTLMGM
nr:unnamed protein product [Callosobruchus chinensis]